MRFNGQKIRAKADDWIEVETPDGPAVLRGYNPALIEYESEGERPLPADPARLTQQQKDALLIELARRVGLVE